MPVQSKYLSIKAEEVEGRYVTNEHILTFLEKKHRALGVESIGKSVEGRAIKSITLGTGSKKILMWSQMHGNESTTTKSVLDLINFLVSNSEETTAILRNCTLKIIPILNPDGAVAYTRINANSVDLNRDAQQRTQPESIILRQVFDKFCPDYCFNLHDQRTIFGVGSTAQPATVSFLAPAHNEERSISATRGVSMQLIVAMNSMLQKMIPGRIGRYDDAFNANCVGDTFQMLKIPTVLFEAGHSPNDYKREYTREYIFHALLTAINTISENKIDAYGRKQYFEIPENQKNFFDIIIKSAHILNSSLKENEMIGILYKEELVGNKIEFVPYIENSGNLKHYFGHVEYDCSVDEDIKELEHQPFSKLLLGTFE